MSIVDSVITFSAAEYPKQEKVIKIRSQKMYMSILCIDLVKL